jgi:mRNA-degrading endonuclease RelE of RelBE toxin-antitoxin system
MEIRFSSRAWRDFADLSAELKAQMRKQLTLLLHDLRHPSLQSKKYGGKDDIWQGRVNRDYRILLSDHRRRVLHRYHHTAPQVAAAGNPSISAASLVAARHCR